MPTRSAITSRRSTSPPKTTTPHSPRSTKSADRVGKFSLLSRTSSSVWASRPSLRAARRRPFAALTRPSPPGSTTPTPTVRRTTGAARPTIARTISTTPQPITVPTSATPPTARLRLTPSHTTIWATASSNNNATTTPSPSSADTSVSSRARRASPMPTLTIAWATASSTPDSLRPLTKTTPALPHSNPPAVTMLSIARASCSGYRRITRERSRSWSV